MTQAYKSITQFSPLPKNPLVSGVIIFYNNAPFLAEAIESVLAQTYQHWELLLVDDGSTDGSSQIAQRYAQAHPKKVRYLTHPLQQNRGKNTSRNLGIQQASGDLIALLDGDDIWLPHKLTEQVAIYQQHPQAGMVYGRTQKWSSWTGKSEDEQQDYFRTLGVPADTLLQPPILLINLLEGFSQTPTTCNAILRREVFDRIGYFDESYHEIFEDQAFFVKVELQFPIFVADRWWARYRKHPDSSFVQFDLLSQKDAVYRHLVRLQFFDWVETYLAEQACKEEAVWQSLKYLKKRLKKRIHVQRFIVYRLWQQSFNAAMWLGRETLPPTWCDWLWKLIGKRLYIG